MRVLLVAKAPVAGDVKTRLGADIGMDGAAEVAAASLLDTLGACAGAFPPERCHLALAGSLRTAVRRDEIQAALQGWDVFAQQGHGFAERLVHAHATVASRGAGPVVQIGMDTPQVTPELLLSAAGALDPEDAASHDAVLGRADDGGWWVMVVRDGLAAAPLVGVAMSTPTTYDDTLQALQGAGLQVGGTTQLRDVDTITDADAVAAHAPHSVFARVWADLRTR